MDTDAASPDSTEVSKDPKSYDEIPFFDPADNPGGDCNIGYFRAPTTFFLEPYHRFGSIFRCRLYGTLRVAMGGREANRFTWGDKSLWNYEQSNRTFREQFSDRYLNQLQGEGYTKKRRRMRNRNRYSDSRDSTCRFDAQSLSFPL